jgi:hypothetical protein
MSSAYAFLALYEGADDAERAAPLLADALGEAWEVEDWRIDAIGPCLVRGNASAASARVLGRFECVAGEEGAPEAHRLLLHRAQRSPGFIDAATVPVRLSLPLGLALAERPAADCAPRCAPTPSCPASTLPRPRTRGPWTPSQRSPTLPGR